MAGITWFIRPNARANNINSRSKERSAAQQVRCIFHAIPVGSQLFGDCLVEIEVDQIRPDQPDPHKES